MKKKKIEKLIRRQIEESIPMIRDVVLAQLAMRNKEQPQGEGSIAKTLPLVKRG
jgi:hypothetical protein